MPDTDPIHSNQVVITITATGSVGQGTALDPIEEN